MSGVRRAIIVDAVRTPSGLGDPAGVFAEVAPAELLATALLGLSDRVGSAAETVDDVIAGCVRQTGEQSSNIARTAALAAGFREAVPGITINRHVASGQQALEFAVRGVESGAYDAAIACGVESMSRVDTRRPSHDPAAVRSVLRHRYPGLVVDQGLAAELICSELNLGRADLDRYALSSHQRATSAAAEGLFHAEIVPVDVPGGDGQLRSVRVDQTLVAPIDAASLAALPAAFRSTDRARRYPEIEWVVTLGNTCQSADGAAAALVLSADRAESLKLRPRAVLRSSVVVGRDAMQLMAAASPATRLALDQAGLAINDMDAIEIDETFAAIPLAWNREFGVSEDIVNAWGGALSLGSPLGATGIRMLTTLLSRLQHVGGQFGLMVTVAAGGMAIASVIERMP